MRIKTRAYSIPIMLASLPLWGAAPTSETASFTLSSPAGVPGYALEPGAYTIHVVNHLKDRVILKLDAANDSVHATFIGVQDGKMERPAKGGQVIWANPAADVSYMKGWYFPGDPAAIEFVYPKTAAVAIASANPSPATVPAVDPASEGKVADHTLSQDDMQLLTLWVLSLQQVGATPEIKAERYQLIASANPKPVVSSAIKALPHTASLLPWVWLVGFCSFAAAGLLRIIERYGLALHSQPTGAIAAPSRRE
jgi:hypothetical protein